MFLACSIAYSELLNFEGKESYSVLPGVLNKSVTVTIKSWKLNYQLNPPSGELHYVIVDTSNPKYFAKFVKENNVIEVFDHHSGFEDIWNKRLGGKAKIEAVGACVTLIWEEFEKRIKPLKISPTSANLIYTAIVSNTLNFKCSVTTTRDISAFEKVKKFTNLPPNWIEIYFEDQEKDIFENPEVAIKNDIKIIDNDLVIGQLELWDSRKFIANHLQETENVLSNFGKDKWFLTSPSISEGINYIYTKNSQVKKLLENIISAKFDGDIGTTDKLWLRKEIIKLLQLLK